MKLGLGTVQFGLDYGISNDQGKTELSHVKKILDFADQNQIKYLDTASHYGQSETLIGDFLPGPKNPFRIITKTPQISDRKINAQDISLIEPTFSSSLKNLKQSKAYGLLIHSSDIFKSEFGDLYYKEVIKLKEAGLVEKIGVSIYPNSADLLFKHFDFDLIQTPLNLFDQRALHNGLVEKCQRRSIEIHVRSIFLQGLFFLPLSKVPKYFNPIIPSLELFEQTCKKHHISKLDLLFSFAQSIEYIETFLIGVNSFEQLEQNVNSWKKMQRENLSINFSMFSLQDDNYLNPHLWRIKK